MIWKLVLHWDGEGGAEMWVWSEPTPSWADQTGGISQPWSNFSAQLWGEGIELSIWLPSPSPALGRWSPVISGCETLSDWCPGDLERHGKSEISSGLAQKSTPSESQHRCNSLKRTQVIQRRSLTGYKDRYQRHRDLMALSLRTKALMDPTFFTLSL